MPRIEPFETIWKEIIRRSESLTKISYGHFSIIHRRVSSHRLGTTQPRNFDNASRLILEETGSYRPHSQNVSR